MESLKDANSSNYEVAIALLKMHGEGHKKNGVDAWARDVLDSVSDIEAHVKALESHNSSVLELTSGLDSEVKTYKMQREKSGGEFANALNRNHLTAQEMFYYSDGVIDGLLIAKQRINDTRVQSMSNSSALKELRAKVEVWKAMSTGKTEEGLGKMVAYQTVLNEINLLESKSDKKESRG